MLLCVILKFSEAPECSNRFPEQEAFLLRWQRLRGFSQRQTVEEQQQSPTSCRESQSAI